MVCEKIEFLVICDFTNHTVIITYYEIFRYDELLFTSCNLQQQFALHQETVVINRAKQVSLFLLSFATKQLQRLQIQRFVSTSPTYLAKLFVRAGKFCVRIVNTLFKSHPSSLKWREKRSRLPQKLCGSRDNERRH